MTKRSSQRELANLLKDHPPEEQAFFKKAAMDAKMEATAVGGGHARRSVHVRMLPDMFGAVDGGEEEDADQQKRRGRDEPAEAANGPGWDRYFSPSTGTWQWVRKGAEQEDADSTASLMLVLDAVTLGADDYSEFALGDCSLQPRPKVVELGPQSTMVLFTLAGTIGQSNFVAIHDRMCVAADAGSCRDAVGSDIWTVADVAYRYWAVARRVVEGRKRKLLALLADASKLRGIPPSITSGLTQIAESSPVLVRPHGPAPYADYLAETTRRSGLQKLVSEMEGANVLLDAHAKIRDDWSQRLGGAAARHQQLIRELPETINYIAAVERVLPEICDFFRTGFVLRGGGQHPSPPVSYIQEHVLLSFSKHVPLMLREVEEALEKQLVDHHAALMSSDPQVVGKVEKIRAALFRNMALRHFLAKRRSLEVLLSRLVEGEMVATLALKDDVLPS